MSGAFCRYGSFSLVGSGVGAVLTSIERAPKCPNCGRVEMCYLEGRSCQMSGDAPPDVESKEAGMRRKSGFEGAGIRRLVGVSGSPLFAQVDGNP